MALRDYTFLGTTQSLCPECLELTPAKIIVRDNRVYFRKQCSIHGEREDFVCSDVAFYDRNEYAQPARIPAEYGLAPDRGCPYDCGLCTEHEQHTCVGLVEITSSCNLTCPMCYASSAPGGQHLSLSACRRAIDRLVEVEGRPEVLQLSGGEPTIHPEFLEIVRYAMEQPIDYVQINTNGLRLAKEPQLVRELAQYRDRLEIFLQLDGFHDDITQALRGASLTEQKLQAVQLLGESNLHVTLAVTLQTGVNEDQLGPIVRFAAARPWITGINFQPATYSGRHVLPAELERRITFPDVIKGIAAQTEGMISEDDFMPLPCAHPNCHSLAHLYRDGERLVPLNRLFDIRHNLDLLANGITFTRQRAKQLVLEYLSRQACCGGNCGPSTPGGQAGKLSASGDLVAASPFLPIFDGRQQQQPAEKANSESDLRSFFAEVVAENIGADKLLRITITSFLDAYTFDVRRLMKCCTHHVLPSGHVIPFCAYNVLYRPGYVPLPALTKLTATP